MYFLDFDRTLFDTDAYNRALADEPACAPFRDDILRIASTPYGVLGSKSPERKAVWDKVSKVFESGALTFAPGYLSRFLYADVPEFLREMGNEALIMTYGEPLRQQMKIDSALAGVVRLTILYTGEASKAEFLATWPGYHGGPAFFVDDRPAELTELAAAFPSLKLYEMRRDGGAGDGRWPVIHSLSELP